MQHDHRNLHRTRRPCSSHIGGLAEEVARVLSPCSRVQLPGPPPHLSRLDTIQVEHTELGLYQNGSLVQNARRLAIYKRPHLLDIVSKVKLWPSRTGVIHGVRDVEDLGAFVRVTTYCGTVIMVKTSRRSRAARWLRNRWVEQACARCGIPEWKIKRFSKDSRRTQRMRNHERP